ncbi:MAG: alpha/beta hydrolase [Anaerolineae bacterium]|nr:alpha/beta hydrolase [Anaerolineae bacterium]
MADGQNRLVQVSDLRLNVTEWGGADNPPLILLHGLASSSHMFDLVAPELAADYHVIAFDQRGHGLSDKPTTGYDFETVASDLDKLVEVLGLADKPFHLAGHSWGASTALYYAATRPERVQKVILIDGGLRPVTEGFKSVEEMAPPQHQNWPIADVKHMIREDWFGWAYRPELEALALSIYDLSNPNDVQPYLKLAQHMQIAQALWDFRAADYFSRVHAPVLAVLGIERGETPSASLQEYVAAAQTSLKQFEVFWMPETIHDIPWHRPHELVTIMRNFLES